MAKREPTELERFKMKYITRIREADSDTLIDFITKSIAMEKRHNKEKTNLVEQFLNRDFKAEEKENEYDSVDLNWDGYISPYVDVDDDSEDDLMEDEYYAEEPIQEQRSSEKAQATEKGRKERKEANEKIGQTKRRRRLKKVRIDDL